MEDEHLMQKVTRWAKMLENEDKVGNNGFLVFLTVLLKLLDIPS